MIRFGSWLHLRKSPPRPHIFEEMFFQQRKLRDSLSMTLTNFGQIDVPMVVDYVFLATHAVLVTSMYS